MVCCRDQRVTTRLFIFLLCLLYDEAATIVTALTTIQQPIRRQHMIGSYRDVQLPIAKKLSHKRSLLLQISFFMVPRNDDETNEGQEHRIQRPLVPRVDHRKITSKATIRAWSTQQLLTILNSLSIRYSPTASRSDLEDVFLQYNLNSLNKHRIGNDFVRNNEMEDVLRESNMSADPPSAHDTTTTDWEERLVKRTRRRGRHSTSTRWHRIFVQQIPQITESIIDRTARKARRFQRRVADFWALDDETGVRDVRYEYLRQEGVQNLRKPSDVVVDPVGNVEVIGVDSSNASDGVLSNAVTQEANTVVLVSSVQQNAPSSLHESRRRKRRHHPEDPWVYPRENSMRAKLNALESSSRRPLTIDISTDFRNDGMLSLHPATTSNKNLPPENTSSTSRNGRPQSRKRYTETQNTGSKKVYNPYGTGSGDDKDIVDQLSEFLADTADRFMWGSFDHVDSTRSTGASEHAQQTKAKNVSSQQPRPSRQGRQRKPDKHHKHWKDRMEERLDSMLGLHQEGDLYRSWTEQFERNRQEESGNDAFFVAQGRQRKKRSKPVYTKPFWEEDGNIFSLLFGRSQSDTGLSVDNRLGFEAGSMLSIFRVTFRSFLVVASYLCRWASTQGALPQPVVVLGVSSAILCARPHRRLLVAGIALLVMRTIGEVLHGYTNGTYGWDEENDNENEFTTMGYDEDRDSTVWNEREV
jgi:hypothetical protein